MSDSWVRQLDDGAEQGLHPPNRSEYRALGARPRPGVASTPSSSAALPAASSRPPRSRANKRRYLWACGVPKPPALSVPQPADQEERAKRPAASAWTDAPRARRSPSALSRAYKSGRRVPANCGTRAYVSAGIARKPATIESLVGALVDRARRLRRNLLPTHGSHVRQDRAEGATSDRPQTLATARRRTWPPSTTMVPTPTPRRATPRRTPLHAPDRVAHFARTPRSWRRWTARCRASRVPPSTRSASTWSTWSSAKPRTGAGHGGSCDAVLQAAQNEWKLLRNAHPSVVGRPPPYGQTPTATSRAAGSGAQMWSPARTGTVRSALSGCSLAAPRCPRGAASGVPMERCHRFPSHTSESTASSRRGPLASGRTEEADRWRRR